MAEENVGPDPVPLERVGDPNKVGPAFQEVKKAARAAAGAAGGGGGKEDPTKRGRGRPPSEQKKSAAEPEAADKKIEVVDEWDRETTDGLVDAPFDGMYLVYSHDHWRAAARDLGKAKENLAKFFNRYGISCPAWVLGVVALYQITVSWVVCWFKSKLIMAREAAAAKKEELPK